MLECGRASWHDLPTPSGWPRAAPAGADTYLLLAFVLIAGAVWFLLVPSPPVSGPIAQFAPAPSGTKSAQKARKRATAPAPQPVKAENNYWDRMDRLFAAMREVESANGLYLVGDNGHGAGFYHIHRPTWNESCRHLGVDWDYDKYVWDRARSEYVMLGYWDRWGATTDEQRARIHNGGPRGMQKQATLKYWRRVKAAMEKQP